MRQNSLERRYPDWGEFIKRARRKRFKSAREFCGNFELGISYPQYSRYEAGDQLPSLDQALLLFELLEIPMFEGLLQWCLAQAMAEVSKVKLEAVVKQLGMAADVDVADHGKREPALPAEAISLNEVIVFNRSHLKLFMSDPLYRDVFTYVNSFAPDWVSVDEVALALQCRRDHVEKLVDDLSEMGILLLASGRCRASKKTFYFPDDEDFFGLRNQNLLWNTTGVLQKLTFDGLRNRRACRGLVTRELTESQVASLVVEAEALVRKMATMPETSSPEKVYSMCVLLGERFSRAPRADSPGLRTSLKGTVKNEQVSENR